MTDRRLRVTEIFYSLQGEGLSTGEPTVFIRLTGCPLRCGYCDTTYAFQGGEWMTLERILERLSAHDCPLVCVTGGEPLAQPDTLVLLERLCDAGYHVSLETSGALDIAQVDPRVVKVVDVKTPGSGEDQRNRLENLDHLTKRDQLKFVICDQEDYRWARRLLDTYQPHHRCTVLFSPAAPQMNPTRLAEWILKDQLPVRLQLQLHKLIWGEEPGR